MTEIPPFLFIITSTALVLGAAITVRGLLGFRPLAEDVALPAPVVENSSAEPPMVEARAEAPTAEPVAVTEAAPAAEPLVAAEPITPVAPSDAALEADASPPTEPTSPTDGTSQTDPAAPTQRVVNPVRDLREPLVMTIAGVLICLFTILGIAALVNSA